MVSVLKFSYVTSGKKCSPRKDKEQKGCIGENVGSMRVTEKIGKERHEEELLGLSGFCFKLSSASS